MIATIILSVISPPIRKSAYSLRGIKSDRAGTMISHVLRVFAIDTYKERENEREGERVPIGIRSRIP